MQHNIVFIGLDTHKDFHEVAYAEEQRGADIIHYGRIPSSKAALKKRVKHFETKYPNATLHFVYEAGPCGYWIYRFITSLGHCCYVVAPSLVPKKPGDRIKTDRRDAMNLARLLKSEDLTPIYVPEPEDEAVRDLARAREVAMKGLKDAKYQPKALLLRNNITYAGTANWPQKHLRWLTGLVLPHPAQQVVLQEYLQAITERIARLGRLDNELACHVHQWRYYPVVKALQAMRGVRLLVAVGVVAGLGGLTRFNHPRQPMGYLGLVPGEHSSGGKRNTGSITKCGNRRARRLLVEGAHSYRYGAAIPTGLQKRQEMLPKDVIDIAWKAQLRLCKRYQRMGKQGKHYNLIITAIAREMAAYMWAIAKGVVLTPVNPSLRIARVPA